MNFQQIKKLIQQTLKETEIALIKENPELTQEQLDELLEQAKYNMLVNLGIDPNDYYEYEKQLKQTKTEKKTKIKNELKKELSDLEERIVKQIPPEKEIPPPQIINNTEIIKETIKEKPIVETKVIKETIIEKELDVEKLEEFKKDLLELQTSYHETLDKIKVSEDFMAGFDGRLKGSVVDLVSPELNRMARSFQSQIYSVDKRLNDFTASENLWDRIGSDLIPHNTGDNINLGTGNITANNLNITNWDTAYGWGDHAGLYLKLDQTTPQSIINGVPLMTTAVDDNGSLYQLVNKEYVDQAVTAINVNYYLLDSASGVSDYKDTQIAIPAETEASDAHTVTANDQYLRGWISPSGGSPAILVSGIYSLYIEANVNQTAGYKKVKLYWTLVERKADTSEVVIGTSEDTAELTTTRTDYNVHLSLASDYTVTAGSRIVGKIYADLSGAGTNPQATLYYLGSINSRWEVPSSTEVLDGLYLKLDQSTAQTLTASPVLNWLTASELLATDANKKLVSLAVATYPSLTELSYVKGVTSAIQTQLGNKQPLATNLTSLSGLTYASTSFVKMTGAGTFALDTNTYYKSGDTATFANITDNGLTASKVVFTDGSKQLTSTGIGTSSQFIKGDGSLDSSTYLTSVTAHNLLSATHGDTTAGSVSRGDIITGQGVTPKWTRLAIGTAGKVVISDGTDVGWSASALGTAAYTASGDYATAGHTHAGVYQPLDAELTGLSALSYASGTPFVKMTAAGTFALDTNTYLTGNQTITLSGDVSGSGATAITTTIGNDKITEAMLKAVDTASDEDILTYESTTGDFEWHSVAEIKTSMSLNNVENTALSTWAGSTNITTLGTIVTGTWSGGTIGITKGGTGQTTAGAAFNALSPMTTLGDIIYGGASGAGTRLAGNTTTTRKFLRQTGDGANSAAPDWDTLQTGDIPDLSGTYLTSVTAHNLLSATHGDTTTGSVARGDIITGQGATPKWTKLAIGTNGKVLISDGTDIGWSTNPLGSAAYDDTTDFEPANTRATKALDNLASVAINTSLVSDTDSTDNLGSSLIYWANAYIDKIYLDSNSTIEAIDVDHWQTTYGYVNQDVQTTASPTFKSLTLSPTANDASYLAFGTGYIPLTTTGHQAVPFVARVDMTGAGGDLTSTIGLNNNYRVTGTSVSHKITTLSANQVQIFYDGATYSGGSTSAINFRSLGPTTTGGSGASVNSFYGFRQEATTFATNSYGFWSNIASAAGAWNFYAAGTAKNYFAGVTGFNTTAPDKQVEINSATGDTLRLTYNDSNGSAANYGDLTVSSGGNLILTPSSAVLSVAGSIYPATDNTYYLGKNDDDTPFSWKGIILKDQTTGTYYRVQIDSGAWNIVDLTD